MTMNVDGISSVITKNKYVYHITRFGQNIYFDRTTREITGRSCDTAELIITIENVPESTTYEEFLEIAKNIHKQMIEDYVVGFNWLDPICIN
mgnify:FL=1